MFQNKEKMIKIESNRFNSDFVLACMYFFLPIAMYFIDYEKHLLKEDVQIDT